MSQSLEEIEGIQIRVASAGSAEPVLVFVHGFACDRHDWDAQAQALSPRFRVLTFDLPGHGESGVPQAASVQSLARTVCEIKARCGSGRAVLIGHSLGCRLVLEAFRQRPSGIVGLVLVDGSRMAGEDVEASVRQTAARYKAIGIHAFVKGAFEGMAALNRGPALGQRAIARTMRLHAGFAESMVLSVTRWDATEVEQALSHIDVPVLILQSTHIDDTYQWRSMEVGMTNAWTELVTSRVPRAELKVAPRVGHFVQIEAAQLVSDAIGEFAEGLRTRG